MGKEKKLMGKEKSVSKSRASVGLTGDLRGTNTNELQKQTGGVPYTFLTITAITENINTNIKYNDPNLSKSLLSI